MRADTRSLSQVAGVEAEGVEEAGVAGVAGVEVEEAGVEVAESPEAQRSTAAPHQ
jgi:hypothetical protein